MSYAVDDLLSAIDNLRGYRVGERQQRPYLAHVDQVYALAAGVASRGVTDEMVERGVVELRGWPWRTGSLTISDEMLVRAVLRAAFREQEQK